MRRLRRALPGRRRIPLLVLPNDWDGSRPDITGAMKQFYEGTPFPSFVTYPTQLPETSRAATGDFNGDGKVDVAAVGLNRPNLSVLLNKGMGVLDAPTVTQPFKGAAGITVADVNVDGKPDIVAIDSKSTTVAPGMGGGKFGNAVSFAVGGNTTLDGAIADLNGDKRPDIAMVSNTGVNVLLNRCH